MVGEYVKKARELKGVTQKELADALCVDVSLISRWESGKRRIHADTMVKIADILGVSLDEISGRNARLIEIETSVIADGIFREIELLIDKYWNCTHYGMASMELDVKELRNKYAKKGIDKTKQV